MSRSPQRSLESRVSPADTLKYFALLWGFASIVAHSFIISASVRWGVIGLVLTVTIALFRSRSQQSLVGPLAGAILLAMALIASHIFPRDSGMLSQTALRAADVLFAAWIIQFVVSVLLRQNALRWASLLSVFSMGVIALSSMLTSWKRHENSTTSNPATNSSLRWVCQNCPLDPDLTYARVPHSLIYAYYPDDPNRYFHHRRSPDWLGPLDLRTFSIATFGPEHQATLLLPKNSDEPLRAETRLPEESKPPRWHINVSRDGIEMVPDLSYQFSFLGRGQSGNRVNVDIHRSDTPDRIELAELDFVLTDDWSPYSVVVPPGNDRGIARIEFHLQQTPGFLELRDAAIQITGSEEAKKQLDFDRCYVEFSINSAGFRDVEHAITKPPGVTRIALLGDSMTEGWGVHFEDLVARQWQKILNEDSDLHGKKFEVLNFGISGYASRQERILYEKVVRSYAPDLVVVLFCFNDDLSAYDENQYRLQLARDPESVPPSIKNRVRLGKQSDFNYAAAIEELEKLHLACTQDHARLVVAQFRQNDGYPWKDWDAHLRKRFEPIGVDIIDLGKLLANRLELNVHAVDGHPNHQAHRIAAEQLHLELRTRDILRHLTP